MGDGEPHNICAVGKRLTSQAGPEQLRRLGPGPEEVEKDAGNHSISRTTTSKIRLRRRQYFDGVLETLQAAGQQDTVFTLSASRRQFGDKQEHSPHQYCMFNFGDKLTASFLRVTVCVTMKRSTSRLVDSFHIRLEDCTSIDFGKVLEH